jgi:hypothetical protein
LPAKYEQVRAGTSRYEQVRAGTSFCPPSTSRYELLPAKYELLPAKYEQVRAFARQVRAGTSRYEQVRAGTSRYEQVRAGTSFCPPSTRFRFLLTLSLIFFPAAQSKRRCLALMNRVYVFDPICSRYSLNTARAMFIQCFAPSCLVGLGSESRDIRLVIRKVFNSQQVPTLLDLLLFFLSFVGNRNFFLLNSKSYFSVHKITAILFEMLELVGHSAKALLLKEFMWLEELGLAQNEVSNRGATVHIQTTF